MNSMDSESSSSSIELPKGFENINQSSLASQVSNLSLAENNIPVQLTYRNLLNRAYAEIESYNMRQNEKLTINIDMKREPGKKTSLNIFSIADSLNRNSSHLVNYIQDYLGTTGSINKDDRLILQGVFLRDKLMEVIRSFVLEYVNCKTCNNNCDTEIVKRQRIYFLHCNNCGSSRSISGIKGDFYTKK